MLISVASQDNPEVDNLRFMLDKTALEEFAIFSDFRILTNQDYLDQRESVQGWHLEQGLVNDLKTILRLGHMPVEWSSIPGALWQTPLKTIGISSVPNAMKGACHSMHRQKS